MTVHSDILISGMYLQFRPHGDWQNLDTWNLDPCQRQRVSGAKKLESEKVHSTSVKQQTSVFHG